MSGLIIRLKRKSTSTAAFLSRQSWGCRRWLDTHGDGTMASSILQNSSDPEATFRSKAGEGHRGYVADLEESVGENGSVIMGYRFGQNTYSDSRFLLDTLTAMEPPKEPVTIVTDGAYPTLGSQKLAETKMSISSRRYTREKRRWLLCGL